MQTNDELLAFVEANPPNWSSTQRQAYIDTVLASIVALSAGRDIRETNLVMLARLSVEIAERKEKEELSDGGKFIDLKLSKRYRDQAASLLTGHISAEYWAKLEVPAQATTAKKPKRWPIVLRDIYITGAIALAFEAKLQSGFIPALSLAKIAQDVPKYLHANAAVYTSPQTLYNTWNKMNRVAHFCAAILRLVPPASGEFLSARSRLYFASRIVDFRRESEKYADKLQRPIDAKGKRLIGAPLVHGAEAFP